MLTLGARVPPSAHPIRWIENEAEIEIEIEIEIEVAFATSPQSALIACLADVTAAAAGALRRS